MLSLQKLTQPVPALCVKMEGVVFKSYETINAVCVCNSNFIGESCEGIMVTHNLNLLCISKYIFI